MTRNDFAEIIKLAVLFADSLDKHEGGTGIELKCIYYQDDLYDDHEVVVRLEGLTNE